MALQTLAVLILQACRCTGGFAVWENWQVCPGRFLVSSLCIHTWLPQRPMDIDFVRFFLWQCKEVWHMSTYMPKLNGAFLCQHGLNKSGALLVSWRIAGRGGGGELCKYRALGWNAFLLLCFDFWVFYWGLLPVASEFSVFKMDLFSAHDSKYFIAAKPCRKSTIAFVSLCNAEPNCPGLGNAALLSSAPHLPNLGSGVQLEPWLGLQ